MPTPPASTIVRCRDRRVVLSGWLPIPDVPNGALLRPYLPARHPVEAKPSLRRAHGPDWTNAGQMGQASSPGHRIVWGTSRVMRTTSAVGPVPTRSSAWLNR
jgi:hypothetical protein